MEFVENIEKEEYEIFVSNHQKGHFLQSFYWGEVSKFKHFIPHYVGLKKDGKLVATALLLEKKLIKNYSFFYVPRGFVCDYTNLELLKIFTGYLKKYCKKHHGLFLRIDPDIKLQNLDCDGNILDGNTNFELVDYLTKLGYKHKGFNKNFENNEPRYTFRLDIDKNIEEIHKLFHPTTRGIINKGNMYNLELYKGDSKDIESFYETMKDTAKREELVLSPIDYYENFYNILNKNNMSDIYIAKVNIKLLKEFFKNKIDSINKEIEKYNIKDEKKNQKKIETKLKELDQSLIKNMSCYEEVNKIDKDELILSSIITAKYQNKIWTIHGGNVDELRFLNANYWLYYTIIDNSIKEGYKIFDFFGTTGNPDNNNPIYGIHLFKKRFGGEYLEFIGEFDYVLKPLLYFGYIKIFPKIRKLIKK